MEEDRRRSKNLETKRQKPIEIAGGKELGSRREGARRRRKNFRNKMADKRKSRREGGS
jgi:hypothetical protein